MLLMSLKTQKNTSDLFVKFIKVSKVPIHIFFLKRKILQEGQYSALSNCKKG